MTKVILSVTNDLFCDQRVEKTAETLAAMGCDVLLVGRCYRNSPSPSSGNYSVKRLHLFFRKGALFYAEFNLRLFLFLLFQKCDILVSNDLDTLLPNLLISKLRRKKLVYDSHEYFCGILEIQNRPRIKKIWQKIEKFCFPKLNNIITVSQSIAEQYGKEYGKNVTVVRNIPRLLQTEYIHTRKSLQLPEDKFIIILQGNAIHKGRGGEEMIEAMTKIDNALLLVIGQGDVILEMKQMAKTLQIEERILFINRVAPQLLRNYTHLADLGVSFDQNLSLNHYFSLPNKIFEYIHAEVPVLTSNLPERKRIVEQYQVGIVIDNFSPTIIAKEINKLIENKEIIDTYKKNCREAAQVLNWENEEKLIQKIYQPLISSINE
jgi:glycosyltransferase involved in cell wall biosynthesis